MNRLVSSVPLLQRACAALGNATIVRVNAASSPMIVLIARARMRPVRVMCVSSRAGRRSGSPPARIQDTDGRRWIQVRFASLPDVDTTGGLSRRLGMNDIAARLGEVGL